MPTDPNNTRYPAQFEQGDDDWDGQMEQNLDNLAVDVPQSGTLANRPDPTADFAPDEYYAEDVHQRFYNEGTSWRTIDGRSRLLSTFNTLQEAVDWGKTHSSPAAAVIVDGVFETDEGTVTLPNRSVLRGMGNFDSQIIATSSTTDPLFEYPDGPNTMCQWQNIEFHNNGNVQRPFFKCAVSNDSFTGFLGTNFLWQNLYINDFGGLYPVDLVNMWGGTVFNVFISCSNSTPTGAVRMKNCNACSFDALKVVGCVSADGETPTVYVDGCTASHMNAPHLEHVETDAVLQISGSGSMFSVTGLHIEPHDYNVNAGIQIGDGGISQGNVVGGNGTPHVYFMGGVIHGNASQTLEGIRHLGGELGVYGLRILDGNGIEQYINHGGSNHDSVSTNPERAVIMGCRDVTVNNNSTGGMNLINFSGKSYDTESGASSTMELGEMCFVENGTGTHSLVKRDGDGTIHVWDPDRTL